MFTAAQAARSEASWRWRCSSSSCLCTSAALVQHQAHARCSCTSRFGLGSKSCSPLKSSSSIDGSRSSHAISQLLESRASARTLHHAPQFAPLQRRVFAGCRSRARSPDRVGHRPRDGLSDDGPSSCAVRLRQAAPFSSSCASELHQAYLSGSALRSRVGLCNVALSLFAWTPAVMQLVDSPFQNALPTLPRTLSLSDCRHSDPFVS